MNEFYIDLGVSIVFTLLRSLKGSEKKAFFKKMFLKLYNNIKLSYADDPDFQ